MNMRFTVRCESEWIKLQQYYLKSSKMLNQKDLFEKALMVEKPWFVHEIIFDQNTSKLDFPKINPHYVTHSM